MIKDEIKYAQRNLADLKMRYKNLVKEIKETFYDKVRYLDDDSPRKPKNEQQKLQAALCLVEGRCPRSRYNFDIRQAKTWKKGEPDVWLDYWYINQDRFNNNSGIPPTIVIKKKNLKLLKDICKELWIKEVGASFRPNTTLGLEEWIEKTDVDKIYKLMCENLNEVRDTRVNLVTDKNLSIKDIVVIYPERGRISGVLL
jgi:hypothetical protein